MLDLSTVLMVGFKYEFGFDSYFGLDLNLEFIGLNFDLDKICEFEFSLLFSMVADFFQFWGCFGY